MLKASHISLTLGSFHLSIDDYQTRGRRNFIMGENGSGKSSFLKAICGLNSIDAGSIYMDDIRIDNLPPWKRKVSYIPQNLLLFPQYSVRDNLAVSIRYGNGDPEIFRDVIQAMRLEEILDRSVYRISGGQAQRVAVARALISRPKMLLMDEPFSMQDERARMSLISSLFDLIEEFGISYIYVTHNSRDLELGYDSITTVENGKIVESAESISDLKSYRSWILMDYRNIVRVNDKFYRLNESAIVSDPRGYRCNCTRSEEHYVCTVYIDGEKYFFTSGKKYDSVSFNLSMAEELSD
ncbi:MAG: ATP-binding cassette domain-containing protein [Thermoplasmata archaeon]